MQFTETRATETTQSSGFHVVSMHLANLRYQYVYLILIHNQFRAARESKGKSISYLSPGMDCMKNSRQTRIQSEWASEKERGEAKIGLELTRFDQMETAYRSEWRARLLRAVGDGWWVVGGWCAVEQFCKTAETIEDDKSRSQGSRQWQSTCQKLIASHQTVRQSESSHAACKIL